MKEKQKRGGLRPLPGMRDLLPDEVAARGRVVSLAREVFEKWGYRRVITPSVESHESLAPGLSTALWEQAFKFFDGEGKLSLLRPDMTLPLARVVATRLKAAPLPIRLSYTGSVYRQQPREAGREQEFYQMGIESMGVGEVEADAEVLLVVIDLLRRLKLKRFRIVIGHVGVVRGLLDEWGVASHLAEQILAALVRQDFVEVKRLVLTLPGHKPIHRFFELIQWKGGLNLFPQVLPLVKNETSQAAMQVLAKLGALLKKHRYAEHLLFDFSLVKEMGYYTGLLSECVVDHMGQVLGSGGRYDQLLSRFGLDLPATGFALNLERLMLARERAS